MFKEVTNEIKHLLKNPKDRVLKNDFLPDGMACNAQFLRYDSISNVWELELRAMFASFKVDLQEHQALALIEGKEMWHRYKLSVVNHVVREPFEGAPNA